MVHLGVAWSFSTSSNMSEMCFMRQSKYIRTPSVRSHSPLGLCLTVDMHITYDLINNCNGVFMFSFPKNSVGIAHSIWFFQTMRALFLCWHTLCIDDFMFSFLQFFSHSSFHWIFLNKEKFIIDYWKLLHLQQLCAQHMQIVIKPYCTMIKAVSQDPLWYTTS